MEVDLYVYDLSQGLARQFSIQFLGTQIDAIYHTSIVFDGIEYFFGQGIQSCLAGTSHHGEPMEVRRLGKTSLPMEVIIEYLESLKTIYTAESYDLFLKNCNNFSNDFAMFLVGKEIPPHITSLPQTVLETPFGRMLQPQIDRALRPVTQAPISVQPSSRTELSKAVGINSHPHTRLKVPKLLNATSKPVIYTKVPPLDKLVAKLDTKTQFSIVDAMVQFIKVSHGTGPQQARIPSLPNFGEWLRSSPKTLPSDKLFAAYDLFRLALADQRISAFFAEEESTATILELLKHFNQLGIAAPYNLRIVTLHMACNLFSSPLASQEICRRLPVIKELMSLIATSLQQEERENVRIAAASLSFNISVANHGARIQKGEDVLQDSEQVEMLALVLEAFRRDESKEACKGLALTLGLLVYCAPVDGEVLDLCRVMEAAKTVSDKEILSEDGVTTEVAKELLGKGLEIS